MRITDYDHVAYDLGSVNLSALKRECTRRANLYNQHWQVWIHAHDYDRYQRSVGFGDLRKFRIRFGWWIITKGYYRNPADDNYKLVYENKGI